MTRRALAPVLLAGAALVTALPAAPASACPPLESVCALENAVCRLLGVGCEPPRCERVGDLILCY